MNGLIAAGMAHARQLERLELDSVVAAGVQVLVAVHLDVELDIGSEVPETAPMHAALKG